MGEKAGGSIWSLSGIGSALGGAFFDDPASSSDEEPDKCIPVPVASKNPAVEVKRPGNVPATATATATATAASGASGAATSSSSISSNSAGNGGGGEGKVGSGASSPKTGIFGGVMGAASAGLGAVGYVVPTFGALSPKREYAHPEKIRRPRRKGEQPVAGASCADFKRMAQTDEFHTWYQCDATTFQLRVGPNYEKLKKKGPSADALYEVVGLDVYKSASKIDNIGSKVQLPVEWTNINTNNPLVPPVFIVQCQLPEVTMLSSLPSFSEITDGPGWSITVYFRIKESTAAALKDMTTASGGLKLFADYCSNAPEHEGNLKSPYRGRFKVCPRIDNIEELSLPYIVSSYNCKPALIVKTGTVYRGNGYIEVDTNVHNFGSPARAALQILRFDLMTANFGFCIESREESEMPEVIFGCMCLNRHILSLADEWEKE